MPIDPLEGLKGDDLILAEAKDRFKRCKDWEQTARDRFLEDYKFAEGDARNMYQWPDGILKGRQGVGGIDDRPCLTVNHVRQHNNQIINDAKQNKPSVKIRATGGKATTEAADIFEGIIRHIEYISNAQVAYDTATEFQVKGGWGYWRVVTDWADSEGGFDQEIFIRRVKDPLTVYLDPDIKEADGSDARFGFVFEDMPRDEFNKKYPEYKHRAPALSLMDMPSWVDDNHVRIAEYFRVVQEKDRFFTIDDPQTGERVSGLASKYPELMKAIKEDPSYRDREIEKRKIEHYFLIGDEIDEKREWPGKYIPLIRLIGEETIVENELDRKGHTRAMIDPQRQYNYWASSAVEQVALQGKTPWVAPAIAIEGRTTQWETANTKNWSVLTYNHRDDDGNEIPAPERAEPPAMATAYVQGMQVARDDLMGSTGQYQAQLGQPGNERSGKAIAERQRQGDNATYHYVDQQAIAIRFTGKILLDLIPKVYDTERVIKIQAENGDELEVHIDPNAQDPYQKQQAAPPQPQQPQMGAQGQQPGPQQLGQPGQPDPTQLAQQAMAQQQAQEQAAVKHIFNPSVGKYEVEADIGPSYATQRQETWNALMQIATMAPEMFQNIFGDLMFEAADFPKAEEIAERMKRAMSPGILGQGLPPQIQKMLTELQQQAQQAGKIATDAMTRLGEAQKKLQDRDGKLKAVDEQKNIDVYDAFTRRITAVSNATELRASDPTELQELIHQMVGESLKAHIGGIIASNSGAISPPPIVDATGAPMMNGQGQ